MRPRPGHAASGGTTTGIADDSDAESVKSYSSACSTASACEHASFALNGTTWSGRSRKYVVHCSNNVGDNEQYLTPTQRAARQVRKFQVIKLSIRYICSYICSIVCFAFTCYFISSLLMLNIVYEIYFLSPRLIISYLSLEEYNFYKSFKFKFKICNW